MKAIYKPRLHKEWLRGLENPCLFFLSLFDHELRSRGPSLFLILALRFIGRAAMLTHRTRWTGKI